MLSRRIERVIFKLNEMKHSEEGAFEVLKDICLDFDIKSIFLGVFFGEQTLTESFLLRSSYLKNWETYYIEKRCYLYDPIFNSLGKIHFPFEWSIQRTQEDIFLQRELMNESYKFGINKGTTIPLLPHQLFQGFLTAINHVSLHPDVVHTISLAANICTDKIIKSRKQKELYALTTREKEILLEKSYGASVKNISRKMNVSVTTVAFHLANIRKKLCVETTERAVLKFLMHY